MERATLSIRPAVDDIHALGRICGVSIGMDILGELLGDRSSADDYLYLVSQPGIFQGFDLGIRLLEQVDDFLDPGGAVVAAPPTEADRDGTTRVSGRSIGPACMN